MRGQPQSVSFHANVAEYLSTILAAQSQPKTRWLMMQMTITHPERKRVRDTLWPQKGPCMHVLTTARAPLFPQVRDTFGPEWGDGEVRITPENRWASRACKRSARRPASPFPTGADHARESRQDSRA